MSEPCPLCAACASPDGELRVAACAHLGERYVRLWEFVGGDPAYDVEGPMSDAEAECGCIDDLLAESQLCGIERVLLALAVSCPHEEDPRLGRWYKPGERAGAWADFERRRELLRLETAEP